MPHSIVSGDVPKEAPTTLPQFKGEKVLSLETYRRSGDPVRTPVWFLEENGVLYVHTAARTGKAKRIKRNPQVRIAPSSFRGTPKADYVDAQAEIETNPETVEKYYSRIYKKYGLQGVLVRFIQRLNRVFSRTKTKPKSILILIHPGR